MAIRRPRPASSAAGIAEQPAGPGPHPRAGSPVALLLIDVVNELSFSGGPRLARRALPMARRLAALKRRAKAAGIAAIYVNDNFGQWRSDLRQLVERCRDERAPGGAVTRLLEPDEDDYFVLKPKHSAFYQTPLDELLRYLGTRTLILSGMAGNQCVLYSANDAHMREYRIVVPSDCIASETVADDRYALRQMRGCLHAQVRPSQRLDLGALVRAAERSSTAQLYP